MEAIVFNSLEQGVSVNDSFTKDCNNLSDLGYIVEYYKSIPKPSNKNFELAYYRTIAEDFLDSVDADLIVVDGRLKGSELYAVLTGIIARTTPPDGKVVFSEDDESDELVKSMITVARMMPTLEWTSLRVVRDDKEDLGEYEVHLSEAMHDIIRCEDLEEVTISSDIELTEEVWKLLGFLYCNERVLYSIESDNPLLKVLVNRW